MREKLMMILVVLVTFIAFAGFTSWASQTTAIDGTYQAIEGHQDILASDNYFPQNVLWEERGLTNFTVIIMNQKAEIYYSIGGVSHHDTGEYLFAQDRSYHFNVTSPLKTGSLTVDINGDKMSNGVLSYYDQLSNQNYWIEIRDIQKVDQRLKLSQYDPPEPVLSVPGLTQSGQSQLPTIDYIMPGPR